MDMLRDCFRYSSSTCGGHPLGTANTVTQVLQVIGMSTSDTPPSGRRILNLSTKDIAVPEDVKRMSTACL
ncbi:hypothetical protein M378DRAFT_167985 [Amanita muscaria Koide BX008]|uniref:Uncharacterized protein n=1 Tax=Amanita muscaria (strain Koide BX008) TaxID=946122 RepID=A0A0C2T1I0_AMAMK|nr:hypothetical protein M378DRAFT_168198 [Amanita muscaria Koide BX008]KIL60504.1 hypothetical protein M378DRAFT_167985 [Amanita muscaria Koide BX008]